MKLFDNNTKPKWIDMRSNAGCPEVLNILNINTSSISTVCNVIRFLMKKKSINNYLPSRLYLYYFTRLIENKLDKNLEVKVKNIFKCINTYGICLEKDYSYDISKVNIKPEIDNFDFSINYKLINEDINEIKEYLINNIPVIFTFDIFLKFNSEKVSKTGIIKMPKNKERPIGKLTCAIYGFRNSTKTFICMNNIGNEWGERGFFYLPYKYVKKYAYNFYIIDI
jgi:hypothetical protein